MRISVKTKLLLAVRVTALAVLVLAIESNVPGQVLDSGTVTLQALVSGYVEVRAGGPAVLSGNSGGGITNNKIKGERLNNPTTLTIDFGDVGPANGNNFVAASIPIRLRSNVSYTLRMSVTPIVYGGGPSDSDSVTLNDVGFGVISAARDIGVGMSPGADTVAAASSGDPTSPANGGPNAAGRYVYNPDHSLANYTSSRTLVNGPRINRAMVPTANSSGLVITTLFAVKPQFYTPGSFSSSVTFTISSP